MNNQENLKQIQESLFNEKLNLSDYINEIVKRIKKNEILNILIEDFAEEARKKADEIGGKIEKGHQGKLAGLTVVFKDNIYYSGHVASAGSQTLKNFISPYNATVVERLINEDAIIIGRANCDEFGMGSSGEKSAFGKTLNPLDINRVPGGSSSGSAAAIAAGLCQVALGSDTGGSVRQPASFCGVIGFKPTYGRVSKWGLIPYASSFDHIGILSRNVFDCHKTMQIIEGPDNKDKTLNNRLERLTDLKRFNKKVKIAILKPLIEYEGLNPEIRMQFNHLKDVLSKKGHQLDEINFKYLDYIVPVFHTIAPTEALTTLATFDKNESNEYPEIINEIRNNGVEKLGQEVKRRIIAGTHAKSENRDKIYLEKAQKIRRLIKNDVEVIFNDFDFILCPTTPDIAFKFGERNADPVKMFLEDIYLMLANITGNPAITLPLERVDGMPVGTQLIGKSFDEQNLLEFSEYLTSL